MQTIRNDTVAFGTNMAVSTNATAIDLSGDDLVSLQLVYTDATPAAKTCSTGVIETTVVTFPTKAASTAKDHIVITDATGAKWAISLNKAGTDPAPTAAIYDGIAAGKKCHVDISSATSAANVCTACASAFGALTGIATYLTVTDNMNGTMSVVRSYAKTIADDASYNAAESGVGSITSSTTVVGVTGGFDPATSVITFATNHGYTVGLKIALSISSNNLPTGLSATNYYAIITSATQIQLATSVANAQAGTAVTFTDTGTASKTATFTPAALGTAAVKLQKSNDGTNWTDISGASTSSISASGNSLYSLGAVDYRYVRSVYTVGTGSLTITQVLFAKGDYV